MAGKKASMSGHQIETTPLFTCSLMMLLARLVRMAQDSPALTEAAGRKVDAADFVSPSGKLKPARWIYAQFLAATG